MNNKEKKLKILMLTEDFLPIYGGVTSVVEKSALALQNHADITIGTVQLSKKNKNYVQPETPYKVVRCKGNYNKITTNMSAKVCLDKNFRRKIEKEKYDIIHCHFPLSLYKYGLKLGKKQKCPVVITAHSLFTPDLKESLKISFLANLVTKIIVGRISRADGVFCVSNFCKNHLLKYGLTDDATVVPNAVDMSYDEKNLDNSEEYDLESKYGFNKDAFVILAVGRLVKIKNIPMLVKAVDYLKGKNPNLKCLIIGDGAERKNIKQLIDDLNLNDYFEMTGPIKDRKLLSALYRRANLVAFLSYGDSSGLIQIEAAYFEKATLALRGTAVSEKMKDLENSLVCENNVQDIANKILYAYENQDKLIQIGKNARKDIYRSYFDKEVIEELFDNYKKVIKTYKNSKKS